MAKQQKIKGLLQAAEVMMDKFNYGQFGSNDSFFAFIDMRKALIFLMEAADEMAAFNKKRNLTFNMYTCEMLSDRCKSVHDRLSKYGTD